MAGLNLAEVTMQPVDTASHYELNRSDQSRNGAFRRSTN